MMLEKPLQAEIDLFLSQVALFKTRPPMESISQYVQEKRILPTNTPFPGRWENSKTPYLTEIMDCLAPSSGILHVAFMKPAQIGGTACAENVVAFFMDECPSEILYISATEKLLEKWATKRLDPLIDGCGFRNKIIAQTENAKSRRSGDNILKKEFSGGSLEMSSAQSASSLRSDSKRILIRDEIDGAPRMLSTGEGNWLKVSYVRTNAWGHRKKILDLSTPTIYGESAIYEEFVQGDQRKYFVPCPHCKKKQDLKFEVGGDKLPYGLKAEIKDGNIADVFYECEHCHKKIFESSKTWMLENGEWIATAKAKTPEMRSYSLNSLYSPIGMLSWKEFYQAYIDAQEDREGMRWFTNLYLGLPFKEVGSRPELEKVIALRGTFHELKIQRGTLFLTAGIDVQSGSKTDEKNPPRIEMEIVGHGAGFKTWQVCYRVFQGEIDDPYSGAWEALTEWARGNGLTFYRDDKRPFQVNLIFIDSGDGNVMDVVYRFADTWNNTFPSKGFGKIEYRKGEKPDGMSPTTFRRYRAAAIGGGKTLYEISTNYYKTNIYNNLKIPRQDGTIQKPGFCDFPIEASEHYFKMLTAEEKRLDGSFYAGGRRNEALDCRVMAMCAGDVYLDSLVMEAKGMAKVKGESPQDVQKINHRFILDLMQNNIG